MVFDLSQRIALVTGAGAVNGIGVASARLLAQMGASVFLTSHGERAVLRAAELHNEGIDAHGTSADLTDERQVLALRDQVLERFGRLDILVSNAGMTSVARPAEQFGEIGGIDDVTVDEFEATVSRNLTTMYAITKAVLPEIRRSRAGRIVMVTSVTGASMAMRHQVPYNAAKAGVIGLCRALALDEASRGVTVNAVAPGWIATDSQTAHEYNQGLATPMGRSGTSEEVAALIAWLCSSEASYITGQTIVIDGANSIAEERAAE